MEGTLSVGCEVEYYNLEMIIALGYRVRSWFLINIVGSPIFILAEIFSCVIQAIEERKNLEQARLV